MNIIRENTFRKINLFNRESFFIKETDYSFSNEKLSEIQTALSGKKLISSRYNILKSFLDNRTVIINTLYDSIVILNHTEAQYLENVNRSSVLNDTVAKLYLLGILVDEMEDELFYTNVQAEELYINKNGIPSVTILPTQICNARCAYCFVEHNKKVTMNDSTIQEVICFFKKNFKEGERVLLRWFGGEPLVAKDIISQIIEGIDEAFNKKLIYESLLFTNGSLLTDEIIKTAKEKWHLKKIQLTLDGYGKEHNRRKNYTARGIDYYKKTIDDIAKLLDKDICVDCRVNFDKDNIKQIDDILKDLSPYKSNVMFRPRLTVLRPTDCGFDQFNYITPSDLKWAYNIIYTKLYEYGFLRSVDSLVPYCKKEGCIAKSINKVIIGADGKLYKCLQQVFDTKHAVGDLKNGITEQTFIENYCRKCIEPECRECIYLPICSGGCLSYRDLAETMDISPCVREKYFTDMLLDMIHDWTNPIK